MKKYQWAAGIFIIILVILCIVFWQQKNAEIAKMESLCECSAGQALECFKKYKEQGNNADYIKGVAEFRSFMTAYLFLNDNVSNAEYTWCNNVYGYLSLYPEKVQSNIQGIINALELLAEDYDHPGGFNLVHVYSNELTHGDD